MFPEKLKKGCGYHRSIDLCLGCCKNHLFTVLYFQYLGPPVSKTVTNTLIQVAIDYKSHLNNHRYGYFPTSCNNRSSSGNIPDSECSVM